MNIYLTALGCRLNEAEAERWQRDFRDAGHRMVREIDDADIVVLNTCAVTEEASSKSRKLTRRLHRQNPRAKLVLTGCYSQLQPKAAAQLSGVDLVVSNQEKDRLVSVVTRAFDLPTMPVHALENEAALFAATKTRAFVKVQDGCRNRCTFCIVTVARGNERSRTVEELVDEVNALHRDGFNEVVLTGVHLGGYGSDLETDLFHLVETLLEKTTVPRLRLSSLEPWDIPPHFWSLWRHRRLCPHLHLPLQSGSNAILKRMARRGSREHYLDLVESARQAIPNLMITTDIIVGFPGETEADWRDTLDLVRAVKYAHIHIFSYSPREGTVAARMSSPVSELIKRERSQELHQISQELRDEQLRRSLGQTRAVLWEGQGTLVENQKKLWKGLTDNYLRCHMLALPTEQLENVITDVTLSSIENGCLWGIATRT